MVRSTISIMILALTMGCYEVPGDPDWMDTDTDLANRAGSQSVVGLASYDDYNAGGTGVLIAPNLVLTAGHGGTSECSNMSIQRHFVVRIGQDSKYPIEEIRVLREIEHPAYGVGNPNIGNVSCSTEETEDCCGGGWGIDLGIWVLESPVTMAKPIANFGSIKVDESVVLFGYGPISTDSDKDYGTLKVKFGSVDNIVANANQGKIESPTGGKRLYSTTIHAIGGDSGGPYFNTRGELVGIHTSSNGTYAIGQVLEPYLGWILSVVEEYRE